MARLVRVISREVVFGRGRGPDGAGCGRKGRDCIEPRQSEPEARRSTAAQTSLRQTTERPRD
jgi:hypothetical protein